MGYIGLLLNAPYKIDSMVWMRIWMMLGTFSVSKYISFLKWLNEPGGILVKEALRYV
jgi:hypothetical protein